MKQFSWQQIIDRAGARGRLHARRGSHPDDEPGTRRGDRGCHEPPAFKAGSRAHAARHLWHAASNRRPNGPAGNVAQKMQSKAAMSSRRSTMPSQPKMAATDRERLEEEGVRSRCRCRQRLTPDT